MKVTMLWHGGSNYALPTEADGEVFASLKEARSAFWSRLGGDVGECPDFVLRVGPRGGIVTERA